MLYLGCFKNNYGHSKIAGDFGEILVLYWLSKHGFECSHVDHTGIDLIAKNPHSNESMGISVKSRTRNIGKDNSSVSIPISNIRKVEDACDAFGCKPYFAIVVDASNKVRVFITALDHMLELYPPSKTIINWKMREKYLTQLMEDDQVMVFELESSTIRWWD